jgi:hypothetical protein
MNRGAWTLTQGPDTFLKFSCLWMLDCRACGLGLGSVATRRSKAAYPKVSIGVPSSPFFRKGPYGDQASMGSDELFTNLRHWS